VSPTTVLVLTSEVDRQLKAVVHDNLTVALKLKRTPQQKILLVGCSLKMCVLKEAIYKKKRDVLLLHLTKLHISALTVHKGTDNNSKYGTATLPVVSHAKNV
jgi:hypothetical protein